MSYFDDLSHGSKYHNATVQPDGNLLITVADAKDAECLRVFQSVIADAEDEGYEVIRKHRFTQGSVPMCDVACVLR